MKLWRDEGTCLLGFDVAPPERDLIGCAIVRGSQRERDRLLFSH